jgi:hypothetical protein
VAPYDEPIPLDALRDLIALTRSLYVTYRGLGQGYETQLERLRHIGGKLHRALEKAQGIGSWNRQTAWLLAEEATEELGQLIDVYLPAKAVVTASGERLLKRNRRPSSSGPIGRRHACNAKIGATSVASHCQRLPEARPGASRRVPTSNE